MNKSEFSSSDSVHAELSRSASGLRHLRWIREILGALQAFSALEAHLSEPQRALLHAEIERVAALVTALSAAVKPYRDFLERTRTRSRGALRVGELLVSGASGLALPPDKLAAIAVRDAAANELATVVEPQRLALRAALSRAIDEARAGLRVMDERLAVFSDDFVAALYPPLAPDASRVWDDGDPDDDATGGPPPAA